MQMNTIELNIDKYESMLKELGVLKTENEELKKGLLNSHNSDYTKCCESPSGEHSYQDQPVCVHCGHFA